MNLWKGITTGAAGIALILIGSAVGASSYTEGMIGVIAGVGFSNLAILAIIIDKLSAKK